MKTIAIILPSLLVAVLLETRLVRASELRAGAAAVNIDPLKLPIVQNGGFMPRMATRVDQSLFARSLILGDGNTRIAICVVDTCMMDRQLCDHAKQIVAKQTGIQTDRILISATHTHRAPSAMRCLGCPADPDYQHFLVRRIAASIAAAAERMRPARAGWGVIDAGHLTNNRRWIYLPHKMLTDPFGQKSVRAMMHPGHANVDTAGPSGPEDPDLTMLSIQDRQGRPLAIFGNFSMHYFGGPDLSSDYTGKVCQLLEESMHADTGEFPPVAIMSQGTSGDLQHRDYSLPANQGVFAGAIDTFQAYCQNLTELALQAIDDVRYRADLPLEMAEAKLTLQRRLPDDDRIQWANAMLGSIDETAKKRPHVYAAEAHWIRDNPSEELVLQAIRIGDIGIATMPNEVFGVTGLKLKMQSPLPTTMNIELANGAAGYIPPPEQHHLGGYTTWPARTAGLEEQAEPKIVEQLLVLLEDVADKPRRQQDERIGAYGQEILSRDPSGWWRMSAHSGSFVVDASSNNQHGSLEPGYGLFLPGPQHINAFESTSRGNRCVHFAGGRMVVEAMAVTGDYSASLWFWNAMPPDARPVAGYMFSFGAAGSAAGDHLGITGTAMQNPGRLLICNGDTQREAVEGKTELELHRWYHVQLVRQGRHVRVFLDGNSVPEIECQIADTRPDQSSVFVGGRCDGLFSFEGKLDEVAVFDHPLSEQDAIVLGQIDVANTDSGSHDKRANVLFIGVDDLRPELACYGSDYIHSPNIDRLAAEGVLFEHAYCQWAVCMPSRASLLSGLRPDAFQGKANRFRQIVPNVVTMPQHFKNHGYFAQSFGKIYHGSWETAYVGNSFQDPASWSVPRWASSPQYYFSKEGMKSAREIFAAAAPKFIFLGDAVRDRNNPNQWKEFFVRGLATEAPDVADNVPADGKIADAALARMREVVGRKDQPPFFLAVGFQKPHLPFVAPRRYWDKYDAKTIPPVETLAPPIGAPEFALGRLGELRTYCDMPKTDLSAAQVRRLRHGYAACVSYVDAQIGRLLDELEALRIRENTIVVLWSDHGYKLGDFGAWCKHTNFELDTRVPLIISAPKQARGGRSEALVELVDLHPTLSELAGLPIHEGADGVSFANLVRDPSAEGESAAFSQFPKQGLMGYTVRTANHRYTEWRPSAGGKVAAIELYDYQDSATELMNVAGQPKYQVIQQSMQQRLHHMISDRR